MKLCVIGAGTAGLCAARHAISEGIIPTVFEQTNEIGGTWVYTDRIGTDDHGIDIHTSMYKGLRTNLPKEVMGYPDFPITAPNESYIPAESVLNFLTEYSDFFQLRGYIKFLHSVIRVQPKDGNWQLLVRNLNNNKISVYVFDFVMICSGHYHAPNYPNIPGSILFKGNQLHSHDYRSPDTFRDKNVLVIGGGPSGMDICSSVSKFADRVIFSHHIAENLKTKFLCNVIQKPDVATLTENGARFENGSYENCDTVIYCTGYKYTFPFLNVDCGIYVEDNYVQPLYKHCLNINFPTMALIGLPFYVCASQMMDIQVRFVLKYWSGKNMLPSTTMMINDTAIEMEKRFQKGYKKRQAHMMGPDQIDYYGQLAKTADIENIKPVMTSLHNESSQRFLDDLLHFRNDIFRIIDDKTFIKYN